MKIPIVECFQSIQGEPLSIGKPAVFIRFPNCTLKCKWCDTKYASRVKTAPKRALDAIIKQILSYPTRLIVFTGGEPLLYKKEIKAICYQIPPPLRVEIETNGTIMPIENFGCQYNVSPKLSSSGNPSKVAIQIPILKEFNKLHSIFKFVIKTKTDWKEMEKIIKKVGIQKEKVWIMPCGATRLKWINNAIKLIPKIKEANYNLAPRLQIILWNKKKGV